jgi:hypothetical protein
VVIAPEFRGPSLHIAYRDPELATAHGNAWHDPENEADQRFALVSSNHDAATSFRNWRRRILRGFPKLEIATMNPTLATALVLAVVASVLLVAGVQQQRQKTVADLIKHATAADPSVRAAVEPGVIYQKVAIRTTRRTLERTIYRDVQGVRRPHHRQLSAEDEQLKNRLTNAGVNWDAPLSVVDYAQWRRRSNGTRDAVTRTGHHLLTLSTTPDADGEVLKETLTVRDTDFHAVDRTVELRDSGTVEIAELSYDVLPWASASPDWFEPLPGSIASVAILPALKSHLPQVLSEQVLDEAELEARVALNQLHADTGERIRLARTAGAIHVKGVVDTDVRKRELLSRLSALPHVEASILSVEEVNSQPQSGSPFENSQPIQVYSIEAQASPLELYLRENKLPIDQLTSISHNLLDGGLTMQQAQVHFAQLQPRFEAANQLPPHLQGQLASLARNYLDAVSAGLDANARLMQSIGLGSGSAAASPEPLSPQGDSDEPMNRYQQLCRELINGGSAQSRPAAVIASELTNTGAQIRRRVAQASATIPQPNDP